MPETMKKLSEVYNLNHGEGPIACPTCQKHVFFDWGLKLLTQLKNRGVTQKFSTLDHTESVMICAGCHTPIVSVEGTYFDASEYVSAEEIQSLIEMGTSDKLALPPRRMDP